jgi:hypothetical protein
MEAMVIILLLGALLTAMAFLVLLGLLIPGRMYRRERNGPGGFPITPLEKVPLQSARGHDHS